MVVFFFFLCLGVVVWNTGRLVLCRRQKTRWYPWSPDAPVFYRSGNPELHSIQDTHEKVTIEVLLPLGDPATKKKALDYLARFLDVTGVNKKATCGSTLWP